MTKKEYLAQARGLDMLIKSKLEQIELLKSLAEKCTITLTGMPGNPNRSASIVADTVAKIVDLQIDIIQDIDNLVDMNREIIRSIKTLYNTELQTLLELRYLGFKTWEEIAVELKYNIRQVYRLHDEALANLTINEKYLMKCHS